MLGPSTSVDGRGRLKQSARGDHGGGGHGKVKASARGVMVLVKVNEDSEAVRSPNRHDEDGLDVAGTATWRCGLMIGLVVGEGGPDAGLEDGLEPSRGGEQALLPLCLPHAGLSISEGKVVVAWRMAALMSTSIFASCGRKSWNIHGPNGSSELWPRLSTSTTIACRPGWVDTAVC